MRNIGNFTRNSGDKVENMTNGDNMRSNFDMSNLSLSANIDQTERNCDAN